MINRGQSMGSRPVSRLGVIAAALVAFGSSLLITPFAHADPDAIDVAANAAPAGVDPGFVIQQEEDEFQLFLDNLQADSTFFATQIGEADQTGNFVDNTLTTIATFVHDFCPFC